MAIAQDVRQRPAPLQERGWVHLGRAQARLDISLPCLLGLMHEAGLSDAWGHPSGEAVKQENARWMAAQQQYLWRLEDLGALVAKARDGSFPNWGREGARAQVDVAGLVPMHQIGHQFGRSAVEVGRELKRMGWRSRNGMPTTYVLANGIAQMGVTHCGRIRVHWDLERVTRALKKRGWEVPKTGPQARTWPRPAKIPVL